MTKGTVAGVVGNLVTVNVTGPVGQNEICYVSVGGKESLMAEVIKVTGNVAFTQVYESTRGLRMGDAVDFTGHMLEVELGPGILSKNFDGLQNDLDKKTGVFLIRGEYTPPLEKEKLFEFKPLAKVGENVVAGDWLGGVKENMVDHKIMVPFKFEGRYKIESLVAAGKYKLEDTIAVLTDDDGKKHIVTMVQRWPVKKAIKA
jgi:V/A-type H+-transporting ATPase subunit A